MSKRKLQEGRIAHIRDICKGCLERDSPYSDRAWLAETVLDILDGNIDAQIEYEQLPPRVRAITVPQWGPKR